MSASRGARNSARLIEMGSNMRYQIEVIGDDDLPSGTEWAAARRGSECYLFVRSGPIPIDAMQAVERMVAGYSSSSSLSAALNA
jgi:hypothetical protein